MIIQSLNQWWLLKSFISNDEHEDPYLKNRLEKQPLCCSMHLDYIDKEKFRVKFEWYSRVKSNDWMRVQRTTDIVLSMREDKDHLYIEASDANYVFTKLSDE